MLQKQKLLLQSDIQNGDAVHLFLYVSAKPINVNAALKSHQLPIF
jgi:hypothetical protein